jgi:hypothetical protein
MLILPSEYVKALAESPAKFLADLKSVSCDDTFASDEGFTRLAVAVPMLQTIAVHDATRITDGTLIAIVKRCFHIESIAVTGNRKIGGSIIVHAFARVIKDIKVCTKLRKLDRKRGGCLRTWIAGAIVTATEESPKQF